MAISYIANFNYNTQYLILTDTRDYAGEGLAAGVGIFKVTDPLGNVIYKNAGYDTDDYASADVTYGLTTTLSVALPLTSGAIIEGIYTVSMKNQVTGPVETELTQTYNYANPSVTVDIDISVNVETPSVLAEDATVYGSGSSVTRAWEVFYPPSLALSSITGTAGSILLQAPTDIYTGSYQARLISTVSYTIGASATLGTTTHIMSAVFTSIKAFTVDSSTLCASYTCVLAMETHYQTLLSTDNNAAVAFKPRLDHAIRLINLILAGMRCGEDVTTLYATLKGVYDNCSCSADCACDPTDDDSPTLISPNCPDLNITIVAQGTGITVTPVTVGNTTTYTVALAAASTTSVAITSLTPDEITSTDISVGQNFAFEVAHVAPEAWQEVDGFLDANFVKVTTEEYDTGVEYYPVRYRVERKYVRSDLADCAIVRLSGHIRVQKVTGTLLAEEFFDLPGVSGTRYRPENAEFVQATLMTGGAAIATNLIIQPYNGRVIGLGGTDLSTLTPIADSPDYFILSIDHAFEAIKAP